MTETRQAMEGFVTYVKRLSGDEKGEAQVFCDRLFQAFGHEGYKEAGATLESRQKRNKSTGFIDLLWKPRLLLEMKKRGEKLQRHYTQAFDYWLGAVPNRPQYVILCNFDELWVYDFDQQLNEPMDRVLVTALPDRYDALNFLFPKAREPKFKNNLVDVTRKAADKVATAFNSLVERGEDRVRAQRFMLQCVVALFADDAELLQPKGLFSELLNDCKKGGSTYDIIGGLFRQMNSDVPARKGKYSKVRHFNGGLFATIDPVELNTNEIDLLLEADEENWAKVQPPIFGTLFENSLGKEERHALGAHFTSEAEIQKVVLPTIVRPWTARIDAAKTLTELKQLIDELRRFQVLDPACGSGNFLYVAYRELVRLELEIMARVHKEFSRKEALRVGTRTGVTTKQLHGIERNEFGVELAKVTLMLAKELALDEARDYVHAQQGELPFEFDPALPLDNLDKNIVRADALFHTWPKVNVIIGNPPFQSKNKAQEEMGAAYMQAVRERYPEVSGKADYCVYWFRHAHDQLPPGGRAGLVGTNTIRQNNSRVGGLDHIVKNGGVITEAVSTQVWPGEAVVHVSIVNWIKGEEPGSKLLFVQDGEKIDSPWRKIAMPRINSALSEGHDVTQAIPLAANADSGVCLQGQTHGHVGFLVTPSQAHAWIAEDQSNEKALFPYMIGDDLLAFPPKPSRYVIDLHPRSLTEASRFKRLMTHIEHKGVLTKRKQAALKETKRNDELRTANPNARGNKHHENFLKRWWLLSYPREDLIAAIRKLPRYAACVRVTKRPIFVFLDSRINPGDALQVFVGADDYSFGILQSGVHWLWFNARCSTLKRDPRYTSDTVFDSFPWPQSPTAKQIKDVAAAAVRLRAVRHEEAAKAQMGYRELYRLTEMPGVNPLKVAQAALDEKVKAAYDMGKRDETLEFLLELNMELAAKEESEEPVVGPGLPPSVKDPKPFITSDCIAP